MKKKLKNKQRRKKLFKKTRNDELKPKAGFIGYIVFCKSSKNIIINKSKHWFATHNKKTENLQVS